MRASGSHSVSFEDVQLSLPALRGGFPIGNAIEYIERNSPPGSSTQPLLSASQEVARATVAADSCVATSSTRTRR